MEHTSELGCSSSELGDERSDVDDTSSPLKTLLCIGLVLDINRLSLTETRSVHTFLMAITACLHPNQTPLTLIACVKSQILSSVLTASSSLLISHNPRYQIKIHTVHA